MVSAGKARCIGVRPVLNQHVVRERAATRALPCGEVEYQDEKRLTACPRLSGWISRKAKTLSLSKSLKEGISPVLMVYVS